MMIPKLFLLGAGYIEPKFRFDASIAEDRTISNH